MRAKFNTRSVRVARIAAAGALLVAVPSALAATVPGVAASSAAVRTDSGPHSMRVRFALHRHRSVALAGHSIRIPGRLVLVKPRHADGQASAASVEGQAVAGRKATVHANVKLEAWIRGHWRVVARARTGRGGRFVFHYRVRHLSTTRLRVRFIGDRFAHATAARDGKVVGLAPTVASWYYDQGNTACGFHARYGVANKTLPCGTKVTIEYGGRSLVATVDDRGPYVYGRTYDLGESTSERLGMYGVATVYASRV